MYVKRRFSDSVILQVVVQLGDPGHVAGLPLDSLNFACGTLLQQLLIYRLHLDVFGRYDYSSR